MQVIEYGQSHSQVLLFLHGGGLSWWNYREAASLLGETYHVVLPVLDGHGGNPRPFTTIESNAEALIDYIDEHFGGSVLLIGGVSLGAQVALEMLSQRQGLCRTAVVESALSIPMRLTNALMKPMLDMSYGLIRRPWFSRLQFRALKIKEELYTDYLRDTCLISKESMLAFLLANGSYTPKDTLSQTDARVHLFVGSREMPVMRRSAEQLHALIPSSSLEMLKGLDHGQFSINCPQRYARTVAGLIEADRL
ncbi:MAG: alpha/beta hydrolase [Clostridiales bacterium]|nr:alpha/beta hydrolase [Clostridiales bacterium]